MPRPPLWLTLLGMIGNSACAAVFYFRGQSIWALFTALVVINYLSIMDANRTAVRTAEREPCSSTDTTPSS